MTALAVNCKDGSQTSKCKSGSCETIGQTEVCTECQTAGQVPINGTCTAHSDSKVVNAGCKKTNGNTNVDGTDKTCSKCDAATYFLYKGGCYSKDAAPGSTMCTAVSPNGVCSQAAEGYFVPPGADATHDSVVSCGDSVTGVTIDNKQYKGVASCEKCDASKLSNSAAGNAECTKCKDGFFGATCAACHDDGCATCLDGEANHCTRCKTGKYLTATGTCVETCTEGTQFSTETAESGKKCFACGDTTNGVADCKTCTAPDKGKTKPTCTKCTGKYLKTAVDGTTTCVEKTECTETTFPKEDNSNGNKCLSCGDETSGVPNCAKCTAPTTTGQKPACSECGSGYKLEGGACVSAGGVNLSTGAIAGISVAAVVVVGGLVGFLCWWFICRGKA